MPNVKFLNFLWSFMVSPSDKNLGLAKLSLKFKENAQLGKIQWFFKALRGFNKDIVHHKTCFSVSMLLFLSLKVFYHNNCIIFSS